MTDFLGQQPSPRRRPQTSPAHAIAINPHITIWKDMMPTQGFRQTFSAIARVPTSSSSRYLQQLCAHWAHNLTVDFTPEHGRVVFPRDIRGAEHPGDGMAIFEAEPESLNIRLEASSADQLEGLKVVVASHLDRFAFREAPLAFVWCS